LSTTGDALGPSLEIIQLWLEQRPYCLWTLKNTENISSIQLATYERFPHHTLTGDENLY
jgi:hypothetical protein